MKRIIYLFVFITISVIALTGCYSVNMQKPPEISVIIGEKEIEYVSAKNKWNGSVYDREDTFDTILKNQKDISDIEIGTVAGITFKSNPPDKLVVLDILIDENGRPIFKDNVTNEIPVELDKGKSSFEIGLNPTSLFSSQYNPEMKDMRGFRMIASWGENECEYAFIINTYAKKALQ